MGYFRDEEKAPPEKKQRWEFITLSDFRSKSPFTGIAYGWLWFMGLVGVAVYALDTFTAINLLVFDRWSSQVKPTIPFKYSRWIFAACILLSWALCIYEWIRAIRVIKRDGVAASYMDPVAASLQCMRRKGWKRFLVFTALTKSKKGTDYIAFFVYFMFQGAIRIILAEGPRQVVNALTLYAVMQAELIDGGKTTDGNSHIQQFFLNIQSLAEKDYEQAAIYSSMLFTLTIWVISSLCLMLAGVLYIVFLWHYIPQRDGRLRIYCRRKIDRRLEKIVEDKTKAAIEDENRKREKEEKKAELKRQKTGELPPPRAPGIARQPTLPILDQDAMLKSDDKLPGMPLSRSDTSTTTSTLPLYSSRPPTRQGLERQPTLPDMAMGTDMPPMPSRMASYASDAPLLANAGFAGDDGQVGTPAPSYHRQDSNASSYSRRPVPGRTATQSTQASQRSFTPVSGRPPQQRFPVRSNTGGYGFDQEPPSEISPTSPMDSFNRSMVPPPRHNTADGFRPPPIRKDSEVSYFSRPTAPQGPPGIDRPPTIGSMHSQQSSFGRSGGPTPVNGGPPRPMNQPNSFSRPFSPAHIRPDQRPSPPPNSYEMTSQQRAYSPAPPSSSTAYTAFNPTMVHNRDSPTPYAHPGPMRNVTVGGPPGASGSYFGHVRDELQPPQRSVTAPIDARAISSYGSIIDDYGAPTPDEERRVSPGGPFARSHTAGPSPGGWNRGY